MRSFNVKLNSVIDTDHCDRPTVASEQAEKILSLVKQQLGIELDKKEIKAYKLKKNSYFIDSFNNKEENKYFPGFYLSSPIPGWVVMKEGQLWYDSIDDKKPILLNSPEKLEQTLAKNISKGIFFYKSTLAAFAFLATIIAYLLATDFSILNITSFVILIISAPVVLALRKQSKIMSNNAQRTIESIKLQNSCS
jgi:hypothetical protein